MVELPEGKMKSREGTVVDADDLLVEMAETAKRMASELGKINDLSEQEKGHLVQTSWIRSFKVFFAQGQSTEIHDVRPPPLLWIL